MRAFKKGKGCQTLGSIKCLEFNSIKVMSSVAEELIPTLYEEVRKKHPIQVLQLEVGEEGLMAYEKSKLIAQIPYNFKLPTGELESLKKLFSRE